MRVPSGDRAEKGPGSGPEDPGCGELRPCSGAQRILVNGHGNVRTLGPGAARRRGRPILGLGGWRLLPRPCPPLRGATGTPSSRCPALSRLCPQRAPLGPGRAVATVRSRLWKRRAASPGPCSRPLGSGPTTASLPARREENEATGCDLYNCPLARLKAAQCAPVTSHPRSRRWRLPRPSPASSRGDAGPSPSSPLFVPFLGHLKLCPRLLAKSQASCSVLLIQTKTSVVPPAPWTRRSPSRRPPTACRQHSVIASLCHLLSKSTRQGSPLPAVSWFSKHFLTTPLTRWVASLSRMFGDSLAPLLTEVRTVMVICDNTDSLQVQEKGNIWVLTTHTFYPLWDQPWTVGL